VSASGQQGGRQREREGDDREAPLVQTEGIVLEQVDADGAPVAFEPRVVELAGGRRSRGQPGADGTAIVRGIAFGACEVTFPAARGGDVERAGSGG
jgi:hypothetical protein